MTESDQRLEFEWFSPQLINRLLEYPDRFFLIKWINRFMGKQLTD